MAVVAAPLVICEQVNQRAVQLARESIRSLGWSEKSIESISAMPAEGQVGLKTTAKYLMHQNRGTKPFLMWWVVGRKVPIGCKQGDGPHIRTGGHVGEPGYVNIPHVGQVWRNQRWRHPGLAPKHFMEDALTKAINEARPQLQQMLMNVLRGGNAA